MQTSRLLDAVSLIPNFEPVAGLSCIVENIGQQVSDFQCLVCEIQCDITSIVNHLVSFQHRMAFLKHCKPAIYDDVIKLASRNQQHDMVKRKCFEIQGQEGRGRPQLRHRQNMINPKTVRNDDKQAPLTASSIECPLFDSTQRGLVSTQRTQALYSLRLSLLEELNKRGIPPQVSKEIVEARLRLLEQYEKQGVPFHLAKERVIHEEERWNLLVDFERQSLSFEEAEQRIDRRFCLLKLYESQGMQRAAAAIKIIQEEVVRDFKAEFVKLGCMHTEAQELAEKRLLLLDTYQRQGFSPEEASRKIITEELAWRDSTNSVLRQRQSTVDYNHIRGSLNERPSFWQEHSSVSPAVTSRRDGAAAACAQQVDVVKKGTEQAQTFASQKYFLNSAGDSAHSSNSKNETKVSKTRQILEEDHNVEEAFSSRISKLLEKLVSHSVVSTRAGEEETQDKEAEKALEKFQAWDSVNLSEADKERLLEEFEKKCREEIQKLLAQLLECQVPPEEAGTRLQTLKAEHENRRQALFLTSCSSKSVEKDKQHSYQRLLIEKIARRKELNKDDWTEVKGTLSPERRATIKKKRDPGVSGTKLSSKGPSNFQKQEKRQRSEEDREFFLSSDSGSTSTKNQRCQSSSSRSTPGSLKRRTRKRMQRDNHRQSSDSEESRKSFRKLYTKTKPLGALDFFEQVLKGSSTSDNKTLLLSAGPSLEKRPGHQSPSHLRSFSPSSHSTSFSSYSRNRSRSPLSRIRSPSVKSGFSRRRSRHRSRSRLRSSTYMHRSRTRSPAFRFRHLRKGHVRSPSWHSRLSDPSSHQSRSKSSRSMQTRHREDVSHEKPGYSFRKTSNVPSSPERHFSQHLRSCSRSRSPSSGSGQSFMKRYGERSYSRKRTPLPRLHGLSPPSLADHSPHRKDDGSPRRWSSNIRNQSNSPSRQFRDCVRETSKQGQYSVRYDHHGPQKSFGRHGREGRISWDSERPAHNVKRLDSSDNSPRFHFQSGVWYDSDVDKHSLSSFNSSAEKVLTSPKQQESKADRPTQSSDRPAKLGGPLRERKRLPSMESISSSDNDETADHPANLGGPSREPKRLPSMESISSCDNDESTNHLAKLAGPSGEHKRLPSVETISSSDNESTDHPANLGGPLRERKRLPSMESISSCDNDELYGVEDCDSAKDGVEASGSVQGGIRPSGSVKEGAEPSCSVQNSVKLSGSTKDSVEPSGSDQRDVEPSGSAKDGVELS